MGLERAARRTMRSTLMLRPAKMPKLFSASRWSIWCGSVQSGSHSSITSWHVWRARRMWLTKMASNLMPRRLMSCAAAPGVSAAAAARERGCAEQGIAAAVVARHRATAARASAGAPAQRGGPAACRTPSGTRRGCLERAACRPREARGARRTALNARGSTPVRTGKHVAVVAGRLAVAHEEGGALTAAILSRHRCGAARRRGREAPGAGAHAARRAPSRLRGRR